MPGEIGSLGIMPGYLATADLFGVKLLSLFPRNEGTKHSSHLGMLVLFETAHGYPVGLLDAAEITAIRPRPNSGTSPALRCTRSSIPSTAEIDGTLVAMSRFFVDFRESAIDQAGDYRRAVEAGLIDAGHIIGEIVQVAEGTAPGRLGLDDITLPKSLGIAAQDIAAGQHVLALAHQLSLGRTVEFG